MKMRSLVVSLLVAVPVPPAVAQEGAHPPHWGYAGEVGPEHWSEFESDFGTCSSGRNQSPIDLANFIQAELAPIRFDYRPGGGYQVVNNGHAVQVDHGTGSSITVDDTVFELKQFHFHSPSENTIAGRSYPMEAHFVHVDDKGNLAVVALMSLRNVRRHLFEGAPETFTLDDSVEVNRNDQFVTDAPVDFSNRPLRLADE